MALSKVDVANMVENQMPQANVADNVNFRNIIINGDMSIAQRSTSVASVTSTGYYTIDRWNWQSDYGTVTLSQDTDVPTGQGFSKSFKADVTTAGTVASGGTVVLRQKVEGQNLQYLKKGTSSAESLTCSFWIKSTKTGTYICELFDADNTRQISKAYTVSASDTWEKKELTFAGDTTGALDNDNANSLQINWYLSAGSDYTSGTLSTTWTASTNANRAVGQVDAQDNTSNNIYLTGVQLEVGETASDFEFLPTDVNKNRCYRYCYVEKLFSGSSGYGSSFAGYNDANYIAFRVNPPQPMRIPPSSVTEVGDVNVWRGNTTYTGWSWGFILGSHGISTFYVSANKSSHGLGTNADYLIQYPSASDALIFSAEL